MKKIWSAMLKTLRPEKGFHYQYYYHKKRIGWLLRARLYNQVFCCRALQGESNFNICINCDLTVSCNCRDFDGSARIGNLREQTLEEIFDGEKAKKFRLLLSTGQFPLPTCPVCEELGLVSKERSGACLTDYRLPYQGIMLENTVLCNLRCNLCRREDLLRIRKSKIMSLDDAARVAEFLSEHKLENLYYFNLGEPFLPANVSEQLRVIRAANPDIRIITSTNGVMLDSDDKLEAALLMDYVYISLDGVDQEMVGKYQIGSDFDKVYHNMARLVQVRNQRGANQTVITWKYVLFRWNDHPEHIEKAIELARNVGVDLLAFYPGEAPLINRSLRYPRHPVFRKIGENINGVIVAKFKDIPRHLLLP